MADQTTKNKIRRIKTQFYLQAALSAGLLGVVVVFATLIADRLPWIYDMTADKLFTLSDQTRQVVTGLTEPVEIVAIYPKDGADPLVSSLLTEYAKLSPDLTVDYIDGEREPARVAAANLGVQAVTNGMVIVRSPNKIKILNPGDLFVNTPEGNAFWGERQITGAIRYVTASQMPTVYFLEGQNETSTLEQMSQARSALELDVYNVQTLTLLKAGGVPKDAAAVIIISPRMDLSEAEYKMLQDYLAQGGKVLLLVDVMSTNTPVLIKFNDLTHLVGVDISNNLVFEEDPNSHVSNNKLYLIPGYAMHRITQNLAESKRYVILPIAMGLHMVDENMPDVTREVLLASTPNSWMRVDMSIASDKKTEADVAGPLPLAYAVTKVTADPANGDARVIVIGNSTFIANSNLDAYGNRDFFLNCVGWLVGGRGEDVISPRIIGANKLLVRGSDFIRLVIIAVVVLPLIPFLGGLFTWYLRRNQ